MITKHTFPFLYFPNYSDKYNHSRDEDDETHYTINNGWVKGIQVFVGSWKTNNMET